MTQPISPEAWLRMPWHPKARLLAGIIAETARAEQRLRSVQLSVSQEQARLNRVVRSTVAAAILNEDVGRTRMVAEEHLRARGGSDPEGPARLRAAYLEATEVRPRGRNVA